MKRAALLVLVLIGFSLVPGRVAVGQTSNIAPQATVTASSQYSTAYAKEKAVDGIIGVTGSGEWASLGELNPWIELTWATAQTITQVNLYDRPNTTDSINGGTLTFSDGSSVAVTGIPNGGSQHVVTLSARSVTWLRFSASGGASGSSNNGLSEIEVIGSATPTPTNTPLPTATPTNTPTPTPTPAVNLLPNGDFEANVTGWMPSGAIIHSTTAHSGTYGARSTSTDLSTTVQLTAGSWYDLDSYAYASAAGQLAIVWLRPDGSEYSISTCGALAEQWQRCRDGFSAPVSGEWTLVLRGPADSVTWDDVLLTDVTPLGGQAVPTACGDATVYYNFTAPAWPNYKGMNLRTDDLVWSDTSPNSIYLVDTLDADGNPPEPMVENFEPIGDSTEPWGVVTSDNYVYVYHRNDYGNFNYCAKGSGGSDTTFPTATRTPLPTVTPEPTGTLVPTATRTPAPTATRTPAPTATTEPTQVPYPTQLPYPTQQPYPTQIPYDTPLPTWTAVPTGTPWAGGQLPTAMPVATANMCVTAVPTTFIYQPPLPDMRPPIPTFIPIDSSPNNGVTPVVLQFDEALTTIDGIQQGMATPVAAVSNIAVAYSWSTGEQRTAGWVEQMAPILGWLGALNPLSSVWSAEGGPLWAFAPLLLPVSPLFTIGITLVFIRFFMRFVLPWLLKLWNVIIQLIELIPGE